MSGGALNYAYGKVNDAAEALARSATTPLQRAFVLHLEAVSATLKEVEWALSGDTSDEESEEAITSLLGPDAALEQLVAEAKAMVLALNAEIERKRS